VREEPRGRGRYYHLNPRPLSEVEFGSARFKQYWKQRLTMLEDSPLGRSALEGMGKGWPGILRRLTTVFGIDGSAAATSA
jgi:hypothetical protein